MNQTANRPTRLSLAKPRENKWKRKKPEGMREPGREMGREAPRLGPPSSRSPMAGSVLSLAGSLAYGVLALALLCGLGVGLFESYTWLTELPFFALKTISVQGNVRLSEEEVLTLAEVQPGMNSLAVNIREVEEKLLTNPWIESVSVARQFPDTLALEVREKNPSFWMQSGERLYYVDAAGRAIAPVDTNRFASLPLLAVDQGAMEDLRLLPDLLAMLDKKTMPFATGQLAWVRLSSVGVEMFLDGPGLLLRLGSTDLKGEVSRLERVWRDLKERGELTRVSIVTVLGTRIWVTRRT